MQRTRASAPSARRGNGGSGVAQWLRENQQSPHSTNLHSHPQSTGIGMTVTATSRCAPGGVPARRSIPPNPHGAPGGWVLLPSCSRNEMTEGCRGVRNLPESQAPSVPEAPQDETQHPRFQIPPSSEDRDRGSATFCCPETQVTPPLRRGKAGVLAPLSRGSQSLGKLQEAAPGLGA